MVPFYAFVSVPSVLFICIFEKIKCLFINSMESFVNELAILPRKPAFLIVFLGLFNNVVLVIEIEPVFLDSVKNIINLINN